MGVVRKGLFFIVMALLAVLLVSCTGGAGSANGAGSAEEATGPDDGVVEEISYVELPLTIVSLEHEYTILEFAVGEDELGHTVVTCEGQGFENMVFNANVGFMIPVYCAIIEGDQEVEFDEYNTTGKDRNTIEFTFYGKFDPDALVFYPQEDYENRSIVKVR